MTKEEWHWEFRRLEIQFRRDTEELEERRRNEYYEAARHEEEGIYKKAISLVIETFRPWPQEPFPVVATVNEALNSIKKAQPFATADELDRPHCAHCGGAGVYFEIVPGSQPNERFCNCHEGRRRRGLRIAYLKKHGRGFTGTPEAKPAPESAESREPGDDSEVPF